MENNKSFFETQGILISILGLTGDLSIALMIMFKSNTSDAENPSVSTKGNDTAVLMVTQERLEDL